MNENTLQDRIRGSLIGGAIGDALGYPVEFIYSFKEMVSHAWTRSSIGWMRRNKLARLLSLTTPR